MARLFAIGIAFALALCGLSTTGNAQVNPGFNPDLAWCNTQGSLAMRGSAKWQCLTPGTAGQALTSGGPAANAYWSTIPGVGILPATSGGTGFGSYAIGDILYANTTTTLAKLPAGSTNQVMRWDAANTKPAWINLSSLISAGTGIGITGSSIPSIRALVPTVANNAALTALSTLNHASVYRSGFAVSGDSPTITYNASGSACSLNAGAGDGGSQVPSSNGLCWLASFENKTIDVSVFGPAHNFVADDSVQIQAALNAASALGGGVVTIGPYSYTANSTITIANRVRLECPGATQDVIQQTTVLDYTAKTCAIYSKVTGTTPAITLNGALEGVMILQYNVHSAGNPATRAAMISLVSGFTGIGIQIGNGTNPGPAGNTELTRVTIGGFTTCINSDFSSQDRKTHVFMDCTNGYMLKDSHDDDKAEHVEFWEFLTTNRPGFYDSFAVSAVANNGSGLYRITTSATNNLTTGITINMYADYTNTTAQGVVGRWQITVINSTQFDLVGSEFAPSRTIGTTSGSNYVTVNSTTNLRRGMTLTGTGIPANTTVTGVWNSVNAVSISTNATATGSVTGTFGSTAYSGTGLFARWNANYRSGFGFYVKSSEGANCNECFPFAAEQSFVLEDAVGYTITNSHIDGSFDTGSATSAGITFKGYSYNNYLQFAGFDAGMYGVLSTGAATADFPNTVITNRLFVQGMMAEVGSTGADLIIMGGGGADNDANFLNYGTRKLVISASRFPKANVYSQAIYPTPVWEGDGTIAQNGLYPMKQANQLRIRNPLSSILDFFDGSSGVDGGVWRWSGANDIMSLQMVNDAYNSAVTALSCVRSGMVPQRCIFTMPVKFQVYTIAQTLALPCNSSVRASRVYVSDTVGAATPVWHVNVAGGGAATVESSAICNGTNWMYE